MEDLDDGALIERYARTKSEEAFRVLFHRHARLVYSACKRRLNRSDLAEDAAQAVFLLLARKASKLGRRRSLANWLYTCAINVSTTAARTEAARAKREQLSVPAPPDPVLELTPVVDGCLSKLSTKDREAILLRFFEEKSFAEIAETLGLQEDAARMRVNRALELLRQRLVSDGVSLSALDLASHLPGLSQSPPFGFEPHAALGDAPSPHVLRLASKGLNIMAITTTIAIVTVTVLALGGATVKMAHYRANTQPSASPSPGAPVEGHQTQLKDGKLNAQDAINCMIELFPGKWKWLQTSTDASTPPQPTVPAMVKLDSKGTFLINEDTPDGSGSNAQWTFDAKAGTAVPGYTPSGPLKMQYTSGSLKNGIYKAQFKGKIDAGTVTLDVTYSANSFKFVYSLENVPGAPEGNEITATMTFTK